MSKRKTKIVCTLGPATDSVTEITDLVQAGMDVARLNFSHGTYPHHTKIINSVRKVEKISGKRIAIMQDLQGPKIRVGEMPEGGIMIKRGKKITLTTRNVKGKEGLIPVQYKGITKDVKPKHRIMINDGLMELQVEKKSGDNIYCKVVNGGLVESRKGINLPHSKVSAKTITPKDLRDLTFGLGKKVDYVALSFVKTAKDIKDLRAIIKKKRSSAKIIAKIERPEALENLESIIKEADGIMVARGDLGIEIPAEQVPIAQKRMITLANKYSKPVITATQVLQSMIENPRPTRAEISDAANAVFDHTDAIMLSNETSVGKYPFKATATLRKVAKSVETEIDKHDELLRLFAPYEQIAPLCQQCREAASIAQQEHADTLVIYTENGEEAREIAKFRPYTQLIVITPNKHTARELTLVWGINQIAIKKLPEKNREKTILTFLKKQKIIPKKYKVVIAC